MARGTKLAEPRVAKNISMGESLAEWLRTYAFEQKKDQAEIVVEALEAHRAKAEKAAARSAA